MIKLIAVDLDGTILDDDKNPDSELKEVFSTLAQKGIRYTFVSGRNEFLLTKYIDDFELEDPYVANNGGNIYRKHELLYNDFLPQEYNNTLARMLYDYDIGFRLFSSEKVLGYSSSDFFAARLKSYLKAGLKEYDPDEDLKDLHIYKITCDFCYHPDLIEKFKKELKQKCPNMNFLNAEDDVYCANSITADKGHALEKLCELSSISLDEVMAFGDNGNDVPMLKKAGISVAMGNSDQDVKDLCDYVCGDNNHNGVSVFLKDYYNL